jgi:hypothetical protein
VASARHNSEDLFYLKSGLKNHLETKEDLPEDLPEELLKDMRKRRERVIILLEDSCSDKFYTKGKTVQNSLKIHTRRIHVRSSKGLCPKVRRYE